MSVLISGHLSALTFFLQRLKEDRNVKISDSNVSYHYILWRVHLTGMEDRPFTDEELRVILTAYKIFKDSFSKKNLWPLLD